MKPIFLLLLILLAPSAWAQDQNNHENQKQTFKVVERIGEDSFRSFYMFTAGGHEYTIRADGRGERSFENARSRNFTLKVDLGRIVQLYFLEYEKDVLLIYQVSDRQSLRGYIVRLSQTTAAVQTLWTKPFKDFDPQTAAVEQGVVKLDGNGMLMKIDLRSGAVVE